MADVRLPTQFIMVVIDGIGWKSRIKDLRDIYELWESRQIDGMYTLQSLDAAAISNMLLDSATCCEVRGCTTGRRPVGVTGRA